MNKTEKVFGFIVLSILAYTCYSFSGEWVEHGSLSPEYAPMVPVAKTFWAELQKQKGREQKIQERMASVPSESYSPPTFKQGEFESDGEFAARKRTATAQYEREYTQYMQSKQEMNSLSSQFNLNAVSKAMVNSPMTTRFQLSTPLPTFDRNTMSFVGARCLPKPEHYLSVEKNYDFHLLFPALTMNIQFESLKDAQAFKDAQTRGALFLDMAVTAKLESYESPIKVAGYMEETGLSGGEAFAIGAAIGYALMGGQINPDLNYVSQMGKRYIPAHTRDGVSLTFKMEVAGIKFFIDGHEVRNIKVSY